MSHYSSKVSDVESRRGGIAGLGFVQLKKKASISSEYIVAILGLG
jgi:hypothetical protein